MPHIYMACSRTKWPPLVFAQLFDIPKSEIVFSWGHVTCPITAPQTSPQPVSSHTESIRNNGFMVGFVTVEPNMRCCGQHVGTRTVQRDDMDSKESRVEVDWTSIQHESIGSMSLWCLLSRLFAVWTVSHLTSHLLNAKMTLWSRLSS